MLEDGVMPPRSTLALDVIHSVDMALDRVKMPLYDWYVITKPLRVPFYTVVVARFASFISRVANFTGIRTGESALLGRRWAALIRVLWRFGPPAYGRRAIY